MWHTEYRCFFRLEDAWRTEYNDDKEISNWLGLLVKGVDVIALDFDKINARLYAMYAGSAHVEGDGYSCVPCVAGVEAAALGACESSATCAASAEALHTFTLDSGTSRCFFRDCTTVTPLTVPFPIALADPSGGPVIARASTVLPCPEVPSSSLPGLHLPSFSNNLVSNPVLQDELVTTTTPGGEHVAICQVATSGQLAASCSCCLLTHLFLLSHHRLGHPSLLRLRGMYSCLLVSDLPRSLPLLPRSLAPPCLPCVEGRQRAAPHSLFLPTTSPLHTLHMDVLPLVDPLPPQGPAPSVESCAAGGADTGGEDSGGAGPGGADSRGAGSGGVNSETLSPQHLREWALRQGRSVARAWSTGAGAASAGVTSAGGARARGTGGTGATGARGAGAGVTGGFGARGAGAAGAAGAGGAGAGGAGATDGTGPRGVGAGGTRARGFGIVGTAQRRPFFYPQP
ncbi:unnamed protein product [Closterium sp. NIES-53]